MTLITPHTSAGLLIAVFLVAPSHRLPSTPLPPLLPLTVSNHYHPHTMRQYTANCGSSLSCACSSFCYSFLLPLPTSSCSPHCHPNSSHLPLLPSSFFLLFSPLSMVILVLLLFLFFLLPLVVLIVILIPLSFLLTLLVLLLLLVLFHFYFLILFILHL